MPEASSTPSVALLGTGTMGVGMAHSLLRAGLPLTVWNRSRDKAAPLAADGAIVADSPAEAVAGARVVITMLFGADSVATVIEDAAGSVAEDAVWVQTSTVGRDGIERLTAVAERLGLPLVDAPMVGTKQPAEEGTLTVLASGPRRDVVQPVLDAIGSRTVWLGDEPGPASAMKLAVNAWVSTINAAAAQSIELARAFGLDPADLLGTIAGGPADSAYLQAKGKAILEGRTGDVLFSVDGVVKDLGLIRDAAVDAAVPTTLVDAALQLYRSASDDGHGSDDMAAIAAAFRRDR